MLASFVRYGGTSQHIPAKSVFSHCRPFFSRLRKCRRLQLLPKCSSVPLIGPCEPSLVELQPANWTSGEINGGKWKMILSQLFSRSSRSCFRCLDFLKMMSNSGSVVIHCQPWGFTIMVHEWKTALSVSLYPWTICLIPAISHLINSELFLKHNPLALAALLKKRVFNYLLKKH